jgi:glycosyltransferase involved in cell wall biosynthesis
MTARVSVGLPVYNGEDHVSAAIESVLSQTLSDVEIVVSDNASTDRTREICEKWMQTDDRVIFNHNETNLGAADNFNLVFRMSSAPYFKWLGHDDVLDTRALEMALEVIEDRDDVSIVHWLERMINEDGAILREYTPEQGFTIDGETPGQRFRQMLRWRSLGFGGDPFFGLIRRDALEATRLQGKGMNPNYMLMQELSLTGKFVTIPEVLATRVYNDVRVTAKSMIKWLDPKSQIGFPHFRKAREYFRVGLQFGEMTRTDRLATGAALVGYYLHPRELKGFAWDVVNYRPNRS